MATMTATFIKPSTEPSSKGLYHHPTLTASKSSSLAYPSSGGSSSSSSNSRFPYLAYKSPEALYGDNSSKTAAAEAFLALHHHHQSATNLILRSSSLYDNSNYARTSAGGSVSPFSSKSSHSFAHPDFDASMLLAQQQQKQSSIKSTVIPIPSSNSSSNSSNASNQLPRVEVAKVSTTAKPKGSFSSASSSSSSEDGENYYRQQNNRSSSLVDRLTSEEHQALSRLLYKHFASSSAARAVTSTGTGNAAKSSLNESAVPADYDEEDPRTWPSNWLAQVPTMILSPEVYLASKPLLNAYQRQLIRRLSAKYEPLVVHYLQQLVALRNSGGGIGSSEEVVRKLGGGGSGGDSFVGANILQSSSSSSRGSSSAKKQQQQQQQQQPLLVKSSSHASALSQQQQQQNAANNSGPSQHYHHQQMNNSFDLGNFACHSKEGTATADNSGSSSSRRSIINGTVDVLRSSPSLDSSALSSSSNSSSMSSSRSNSSLSTSSSSSPPPPPPTSQAPQKAPVVQAAEVGATRENRLARLSQQMANKWSNKMKIYLRKN